MRYTPGKSRKTNPYDYFPTPACATLALLSAEEFPTPIWECACGDGAIAKHLPSQNVICTDLRDYGNPDERDNIDYTWFQQHAKGGVDFLRMTIKVPSILTNPPFYCLNQFVENAFRCATDKVALLLDNRFVERRRYQRYYQNGCLKAIYYLHQRLRFGKEMYSALWGHRWAVWEKAYRGQPAVNWLDNKAFAA